MAPIKLYGIPPSPAFRIAAMALDLLGLDYETVPVNPLKGETRTPEFLKLNPQHTIPVLVDGDFVLSESRVIATYLIDAYGKEGCKLMPKDPKTRAIIDQRLHFDVGTFFKALLDHFVSSKVVLETFRRALTVFFDVRLQ
jgi:glutathione S-transferase